MACKNMRRRLALFAAFAGLTGAASVAGAFDMREASASPSSPQTQVALTNEREMSDLLPGKAWDARTLSEAASRIGSLSDDAAAELLWLVALAPPEVDATPVFDKALDASSPRVRAAAVSLLVDRGDAAAVRLLRRVIAGEREAEVVRTMVEGMSGLPPRRAVGGLVGAMSVDGASEMFLSSAGEALRKLTGTQISGGPDAWREWLRANAGTLPEK